MQLDVVQMILKLLLCDLTSISFNGLVQPLSSASKFLNDLQKPFYLTKRTIRLKHLILNFVL